MKRMGGGVSLDLIHELDYLTYLLGVPKEIYNIRRQVSLLEIDSDDVSVYIAQLDNGETLEFSNDILTQIVDRLWDTRDNVSIKIHNNKISLR